MALNVVARTETKNSQGRILNVIGTAARNAVVGCQSVDNAGEFGDLHPAEKEAILEIAKKNLTMNKVFSMKTLTTLFKNSNSSFCKALSSLKRNHSQENINNVLGMATINELKTLSIYCDATITEMSPKKSPRRSGRKHRKSARSRNREESRTKDSNPSFITSAVKHDASMAVSTSSASKPSPVDVSIPGSPAESTAMSSPNNTPMSESSSSEGNDEWGGNVMPYSPLGAMGNKYRTDSDQFMFMTTIAPLNVEREPEEGFLLPPKAPGDNKPTLVLDLDETLIHSFLNPDDHEYTWTFGVPTDDNNFTIYCTVRPYVENFLKELARKWELVVFTASQEVYASQVLDKLDPEGLIAHRLYRESCTYYEGNYIKDLSIIGRPLNKTVLLDNTPLCYGFQPLNGIPSHTWTHEVDDRELLDLVPILSAMADVPDVRHSIEQQYQTGRLIDWLQQYIEDHQNGQKHASG